VRDSSNRLGLEGQSHGDSKDGSFLGVLTSMSRLGSRVLRHVISSVGRAPKVGEDWIYVVC
jgi:hypothetical protein